MYGMWLIWGHLLQQHRECVNNYKSRTSDAVRHVGTRSRLPVVNTDCVWYGMLLVQYMVRSHRNPIVLVVYLIQR